VVEVMKKVEGHEVEPAGNHEMAEGMHRKMQEVKAAEETNEEQETNEEGETIEMKGFDFRFCHHRRHHHYLMLGREIHYRRHLHLHPHHQAKKEGEKCLDRHRRHPPHRLGERVAERYSRYHRHGSKGAQVKEEADGQSYHYHRHCLVKMRKTLEAQQDALEDDWQPRHDHE
jgi:hypothetical protein